MEGKGYVTADGRVTWDGFDPAVVGSLGYKETRYNLRRVYVSREWIVRLDDGTRLSGELRRDVLAQVRERFAAKPLDNPESSR